MFSGLGGNRIGGAKILYVYLLTYSIVYKNTAYFGGGGGMMYLPVLFIIGWGIALCPQDLRPLRGGASNNSSQS